MVPRSSSCSYSRRVLLVRTQGFTPPLTGSCRFFAARIHNATMSWWIFLDDFVQYGSSSFDAMSDRQKRRLWTNTRSGGPTAFPMTAANGTHPVLASAHAASQQLRPMTSARAAGLRKAPQQEAVTKEITVHCLATRPITDRNPHAGISRAPERRRQSTATTCAPAPNRTLPASPASSSTPWLLPAAVAGIATSRGNRPRIAAIDTRGRVRRHH